ncbi:hypothetical protein [Paracoccus litorisediminis]|uniref:Uncharacterized protein n=1 Tax=Paracoccus litorisediminis TaxID=2006130 RepID=A0A844HGU3_9RHOB|nr:hypothetical protein [Paracoccus litorisediminis]MTH58996.1 hypothetical protein [Paracoccus litorisediminis]
MNEAKTSLAFFLERLLSELDAATVKAAVDLLPSGCTPESMRKIMIAVRAEVLPALVARAEMLAVEMDRAVIFNEATQDGHQLQ